LGKLAETYQYCHTRLLNLSIEKIEVQTARTQHLLLLRLLLETKSSAVGMSRNKGVFHDENIFINFWQDFQRLTAGNVPKEESKYSLDRAIKVRMYLLLSQMLSGVPSKQNLDIAIELFKLVLHSSTSMRLLSNLAEILSTSQIISTACGAEFFERLTSMALAEKDLPLEFVKIMENLAKQCTEGLMIQAKDRQLESESFRGKDRIVQSIWKFMLESQSKDKQAKEIINNLIIQEMLGEEDGGLKIRGVEHMEYFWKSLNQKTEDTLKDIVGYLNDQEKTNILSNLANFWLFSFEKAKGSPNFGGLSSDTIYRVKIVENSNLDFTNKSFRNLETTF
jgi:hypothetical protein